MSLRSKILVSAYTLFPFSLKGDAQLESIDDGCQISCVINFYGRIDLLEGILYSLSEQDLDKTSYEVILVEDRGGTARGNDIAERFAAMINIKYFALSDNYGIMGYSRNFGLIKTRGKHILFLDDDTVIMQKNFLSELIIKFQQTDADGIIPFGSASYHLLKSRYGYHEAYFPTNRCMAYRREALKDLGGFVSSIIGQEDVEFVMRFVMSGRTFLHDPGLAYFHPPLLMPNYQKPMAVGSSFYHLKGKYPFVLWMLVLLNCARHFPLIFVPVKKYREMGRFGVGFLMGVIKSPFTKKRFTYTE